MKAFHSTRWLAVLAIVLAAMQWQCTKKPTSPANNNRDLPGQPFGLTVTTGDRQIELSWVIDNPAKVRSYRIYRRDTTSAIFFYLDSSLTTKYLDRLVRNGFTYFYQVSAVSRTGAEGTRSPMASAVPDIYTIRINNGVDFTAIAQVTLALSGPASTVSMLVGNDTSFTGSNWQTFARSLPWALAGGDGLKTVYAKFRDRAGIETRSRASDAITLDTIALIRSVTENTGGNPSSGGGTIHFALDANEPNGRASATIDGIAQAIMLYDDGRAGDPTANDGVYETDYIVPDDAEVSQARVRGAFTDRVNNIAPGIQAVTRVTILKPPAKVTLFPPTLAGNQNALRLSWSASTEADFANYNIYRSNTPGFTPAQNLLLDRVSVRQTNNYTDGNLQENTTYYYQVVVLDAGSLASPPSNEVSGRTNANLPPRAVTLNAPQLGADGARQVLLSWSQNLDPDFASYRILRSTTLPIDSTSAPLISFESDKIISYADNAVMPATSYYYKIYVFDQGGKNSGSNVANITTAQDAPPKPVTLSLPISTKLDELTLSWSKNNDADFASYRVYRSKTPGITINQAPVNIINDPEKTLFEDAGLERNTTYYYRVFVYDLGDLTAGSNEVMGTTP